MVDVARSELHVTRKVVVAEADAQKLQMTRERLTALLASNSARFSKTRDARIVGVTNALQAVCDRLRDAAHEKFAQGLSKFLELAVADIKAEKPYDGSEAGAILGKLASLMHAPPEDLKIRSFMVGKQCDEFQAWFKHNSHIVDTLAAAMLQLRASGNDNLDNSDLLALLSWREQPFDILGVGVAVAQRVVGGWKAFMTAVERLMQSMCIEKLTALYPRSLVPVAEAVATATSLAAWEDALSTAMSAAVAGCLGGWVLRSRV